MPTLTPREEEFRIVLRDRAAEWRLCLDIVERQIREAGTKSAEERRSLQGLKSYRSALEEAILRLCQPLL